MKQKPKHGRSVAIKFDNVVFTQLRDTKGRYTSRFVCCVDVKAVNKRDRKAVKKILEGRRAL